MKHRTGTLALSLALSLGLAACAPAVGPTMVTAGDRAMGTLTISFDPRAAQDARRSLLSTGDGFLSTAITKARITVRGADLVPVVKIVDWNHGAALTSSVTVPKGGSRLVTLEALAAAPTATGDSPLVLASVHGIADVTTSPSRPVVLDYNQDAAGRVLDGLLSGLAHGFDAGLGSPSAKVHDDLLAAMDRTDGTSLASNLVTFINTLTGYDAHTNAFSGLDPLHVDADAIVRLVLANGPTVLAAAPPKPLEAFSASGSLDVVVDQGSSRQVRPEDLTVSVMLPVPHTDGTAAFQQVNGTTQARWSFTDLPPGTWGVVARAGKAVVGQTTVTVRQGANSTHLAVAMPGGGGQALGRLYDEAGLAVTGASLHVESADRSFTADAQAADGSYALAGLPTGVALTFTASKAGWGDRAVTTVLGDAPLTLDFGSAQAGADPNYLTRGVEVVSGTPSATLSAEQPGSLTLVFNQDFDADEQARLVDAVVVLPYNATAQQYSKYQFKDTSAAVATLAWQAPVAYGADPEDGQDGTALFRSFPGNSGPTHDGTVASGGTAVAWLADGSANDVYTRGTGNVLAPTWSNARTMVVPLAPAGLPGGTPAAPYGYFLTFKRLDALAAGDADGGDHVFRAASGNALGLLAKNPLLSPAAPMAYEASPGSLHLVPYAFRRPITSHFEAGDVPTTAQVWRGTHDLGLLFQVAETTPLAHTVATTPYTVSGGTNSGNPVELWTFNHPMSAWFGTRQVHPAIQARFGSVAVVDGTPTLVGNMPLYTLTGVMPGGFGLFQVPDHPDQLYVDPTIVSASTLVDAAGTAHP